jgi:hypothetical protein
MIGSDHLLIVLKMCWRRTRYDREEEQKVMVIRDQFS